MALGLLGARGERHVHRRRSACDRAAFLWGLAGTQAGAGRGKGSGGGGWRGWLGRPEEEEMTVLGASPPPMQPDSCGSGGRDRRASGVWRLLAEEAWRPVLVSAFLLAKQT